MPADTHKRLSIWTPLTFSVILILGILIGFQLNKYMAKKKPISAVIERNDRLEDIIDLIGAKYVDSVSADSLYEDAISGILKHLDPHTVYIPARDMAAVTEDMEGNFKGIGVEFYVLDDTLMITSVMTNGPSYDAGIKAGDKIIKVNDSTVAGVGIDSEHIISMLRGLEGSSVNLTLQRPSDHSILKLEVKRGIIPIYSVDASYMIDAEVGYIRINRFSATTYREFMKAMKGLLAKGMKKMILDLRQNPGGYLDAATAIADELLSNDKLLVYTQGRTSAKEEYMSGKKGAFEKGPLAVLIDEGSASASEIVAGAVQDWDRGVVIGRRSYGKGLVQEQFELGDGSALRLTTARYYTPSGRSIQRPYDQGREAYAMDHRSRFADGSLTTDLETPNFVDTVKYYTEEKHRVVYGGGGIKPDITIPYETSEFAGELYELISSQTFSNTLFTYFSQHGRQMGSYKSFREFDSSFRVTPELLQQLKKNLATEWPQEVQKVWSDAHTLDFLQSRVKAMFARMLFRNNGYYQQANKDDRVVQRALQVLRNKKEYAILMGNQ